MLRVGQESTTGLARMLESQRFYIGRILLAAVGSPSLLSWVPRAAVGCLPIPHELAIRINRTVATADALEQRDLQSTSFARPKPKG